MVKPNFCFGAGAGALGSKLKFWSWSWSSQPQSIILELELELLAPNKTLKLELGLWAPSQIFEARAGSIVYCLNHGTYSSSFRVTVVWKLIILTKLRYQCDGLVDDKIHVLCTSFQISCSANNILSCFDLVLPNYYCLNSMKKKLFCF